MERVAIFVDAGYLYAAGSVAIVGSNQPRVNLVLNLAEVIHKLRKVACAKTNNAALLRIYWYDGVSSQGLSYEQERLAETDDVKLRLGIINSYGQQKGVDSLIVTDLVELARNQAITEAVLLSGDEDVRIGVQIAQSFGVRVHLMGIEPSRGNQSDSLRQETDTTTEWSKIDIGEILTVRQEVAPIQPTIHSASEVASDTDTSSTLNSVVDEFIETLSEYELNNLAEIPLNSLLPREFDAPLLAASRNRIGRDLDNAERIYVRNKFREEARAKSQPD